MVRDCLLACYAGEMHNDTAMSTTFAARFEASLHPARSIARLVPHSRALATGTSVFFVWKRFAAS
jgi:hypothetical protein